MRKSRHDIDVSRTRRSPVGARVRALVDPDELIGILLEVARTKDAGARARISAVQELLDRGYGRPAQNVQVESVNYNFTADPLRLRRLSDDELDAVEAILVGARELPPPDPEPAH